jgi:CxxC-x17-CxxC domain-containing protein
MKKLFKRKEVQEVPEVKQNVEEMFLQLQQQLVSLERKIDTLISQPKDRPFFPRFDRHDRHNRFDRGGRHNGFRERNYTKVICADCGNECEVPFKPSADRPVYCKECFAKRRSGGGGGGDFSKGRHFDKQEGTETRRHGRKSRPNFRRRKERD